MKKLETLLKSLETVNADELNKIVHNKHVDVNTLSKRDKLAVLVYDELAKSLDTTSRSTLLDCNYKYSKFVKNNNYKVDYFCVICSDDETTRAVQIYFKSDSKLSKVYFQICTSCKTECREALSKLATDTIHADISNKTSSFTNVAYNESDKFIKSILAIIKHDSKKTVAKKNNSKKKDAVKTDEVKTEVKTDTEVA